MIQINADDVLHGLALNASAALFQPRNVYCGFFIRVSDVKKACIRCHVLLPQLLQFLLVLPAVQIVELFWPAAADLT